MASARPRGTPEEPDATLAEGVDGGGGVGRSRLRRSAPQFSPSSEPGRLSDWQTGQIMTRPLPSGDRPGLTAVEQLGEVALAALRPDRLDLSREPLVMGGAGDVGRQ